MRTRTRLDHERRIEEAVEFVLANLDTALTPTQIADQVCFSRFHFHRVFQALLGETVGELYRRLRLERSAERLRLTTQPITEIAFDAGYATHEAFIRAFRDAFGMTPSRFRGKSSYGGELPTPNGVHYFEKQNFQLRFVSPQGAIDMNVEIREIPPRKVLCMSHQGHYFMIGQTFGEFGAWVKSQKIEVGPFVGIYFDDPSSTPPDELRSEAGAYVDSIPAFDNPKVHTVDLAGGTFAVYTHIGPYDRIGQSWGEFMSWFAASGHEFGNVPAFEIYVDDCDNTPAEIMRTELCMSVRVPAPA